MVGRDDGARGRSPDSEREARVASVLTPDEFADRFRASYRAFWLIAMSVVRNVELADDAVQEAAVIGLRKIGQYAPGTNFEAWVGTMVRNVALNSARKERRIRTTFIQPTANPFAEPAAASGPSEESSPHAAYAVGREDRREAREIDRLLRQWLDEVTDVARACLVLRTIEGLDYAKISRLLEIPEGTAMSHVHRTRRFLRDRLLESTPGDIEERRNA